MILRNERFTHPEYVQSSSLLSSSLHIIADQLQTGFCNQPLKEVAIFSHSVFDFSPCFRQLLVPEN